MKRQTVRKALFNIFIIVPGDHVVFFSISDHSSRFRAYNEWQFYCILSNVCMFYVFRKSMVWVFVSGRWTSGVCIKCK